jgi:hypothetical protein
MRQLDAQAFQAVAERTADAYSINNTHSDRE